MQFPLQLGSNHSFYPLKTSFILHLSVSENTPHIINQSIIQLDHLGLSLPLHINV